MTYFWYNGMSSTSLVLGTGTIYISVYCYWRGHEYYLYLCVITSNQDKGGSDKIRFEHLYILYPLTGDLIYEASRTPVGAR